ncbi:MAG: hemolysin family protein [Isosphaeraceae bacterium]
MPDLTSALIALVGLPALLVHVAAVMLTRALRSYSRSLLEERAHEAGHPQRASEVAHLDERTERSAETIAVSSGLLLAVIIGVVLDRSAAPVGLFWAAILVLFVGGVGYLMAGVIGRVFAEPIVDRFWPLTPLIRAAAWPMERAANALEYLTGRFAPGAETNSRPASVEVEIPTEEGESTEDVEADLPEGTRHLLQRAVELSRMDVSEVMIPASAIVSLPVTVNAASAAAAFRSSGRSRIPIFGANRDDIVGILIGKDLWERIVESGVLDQVTPAELVRPALRVPETANAFELIGELRRSRTHMAVVLDEYGGVAGLVTLEDLLEQLVGPIEDEHDIPAPQESITPLGGSRYELDATLTLEELNERFDLDLPTEEDFETVGGLAFHSVGRLPEEGTTFRYRGVEFTVLDVRDHSIRRVRMDLQPASTVTEGG